MTLSFFFDESGHSGDLIKSGVAYDFLDQPFFVLAALGVEDEALLTRKIDAMRIRHRIPAGELKSKSLQSQAAFVAELLTRVLDAELPLFVEVVDKRYFICMNLVTHQLLSPVMGFGEGPNLNFLRNVAVDFLYDEVSEHVLNQFVRACVDPSDHSLMSAFGSQMLFSAGKSKVAHNQDILNGVHQMVVEAAKEYGKMRKTDPMAYLRFLPPPDRNKFSKQVWMLPNLSSFTNIYARINLFLGRRLKGVRLVHDQQLEVEGILRDAKLTAERVKDSGFEAFTPSADYIFHEQASLEFTTSHESIGIQISDVIAGTVMRFFRDQQRNPETIHPEVARVMQEMRRRSDTSTAFGLNQVVPPRFML
jgi:hypothetical protein